MPGFCGFVGPHAPSAINDDAVRTLDRDGNCIGAQRGCAGFAVAVAALAGSPVAGAYVHEDERLIAGFAGDLVDQASVPWGRLADDIDRGSYRWLEDCDGHFSFVVYEKLGRRLHLIGDHFGYRPLFKARCVGGLAFATNLPALLHLGVAPEFNEAWFHQFMYFGYWPGQATFLRNATRVAPGEVVIYELDSDTVSRRVVTARNVKRATTIRGRAAIRAAADVFADRMPKYFGTDEPVELPLSGGLDSRTILAYMPPGRDYHAYTYGEPGCADHREAAALARRLELPHRFINFDRAYEPRLPGLIREVVWRSGGLAWTNRAMLPYVYRDADRHRPRTPLVMSGISLDILFRGHNNARGDLDRFLATGETRFTAPQYELVFGPRPGRFYDAVSALGRKLNEEHGTLADSEGYLNYLVYTLLPSYFSADLEICGHHGTMRIPGWDRAIIKLAYEIEYSTIYLSKFVPHEQFLESVLQAHLMSTNRRLARVPLQGIPLWVWTRGNRPAYHAFRYVHHGPRYLRRRFGGQLADRPLEDWPRWAATILDEDLDRILGKDCLVGDLVDRACLPRLRAPDHWAWRLRLASVELILQLLRNGWKLEELPYPAPGGPADH